MKDKKSLAVRPNLTLADWEMAKEFGLYAEKSGIGRQHDSALKAYAAKELGLSSIAGLSGIYIIEGKPSLAPKLAWATIIIHPEFDNYTEEKLLDKQGSFLGWKITLSRKNGISQSRQFTLEDAKRILVGNGPQRLIDKNNWRDYPENTCYWRAMGFVQDIVFPDVTLGLYRADELGMDITPDGEVIESESVPIIQDEFYGEPEPVPDYGFDFSKLLLTYSQTDIFAVMIDKDHPEGRMPIGPEEINLAVHRLKGTGQLEVKDDSTTN